MFTNEILCKQVTRIADALERIANVLETGPWTNVISEKKSHDGLISEQEASERLGLSKAWFQRKRVEGGDPPFVKIGSRVRYKLSELDVWCAKNTVAHTTEWTAKNNSAPTEF